MARCLNKYRRGFEITITATAFELEISSPSKNGDCNVYFRDTNGSKTIEYLTRLRKEIGDLKYSCFIVEDSSVDNEIRSRYFMGLAVGICKSFGFNIVKKGLNK